MAIACDLQTNFSMVLLLLCNEFFHFKMASDGYFIFDFTAVLVVSCWHEMTLFTSDIEASNYAVLRTSRSKLTC